LSAAMLNIFATLALMLPLSDATERIPPTYKPDIGWRTFEATAYTADCLGCIGITKAGYDVRNTVFYEGLRVITVDPDVVALGSIVEVRRADGKRFEAVAGDIGAAINGSKIDILVGNEATAWEFGRQDVEMRIIEEAE
jgi:3D (Asp-Asp-Asp) domain-containing protein